MIILFQMEALWILTNLAYQEKDLIDEILGSDTQILENLKHVLFSSDL